MSDQQRLWERRWIVPAVIVVLALVIRMAAIAADDGYKPANDAFEYDYYARSIAAGDGFPRSGYLLYGGPTAIRGPGYPYLLGVVYAVTDDSVTAGRLAGAALGALVVLLLYLLVRRIWGRRIGLCAAGMAAIFPPFVLLSQELWSESLFLVLELAAILCVISFRRSGSALRWAAAAGAVCGLAVLTRNVGLVVLIAVVVGVWTGRPRLSAAALAAPALVVACAALVIAPWTLRNATEFGRFVPITTSSGLSAAGTYNQASLHAAGTHGAWRIPQIVPEYEHLFVTPGLDEAEVDAELRSGVRKFIWEHPGYDAQVFGWNLLRLFEIEGGSVVGAQNQVATDRGIGSATPAAERVGLLIAAALAALGLIAIFRPRPSGGEGSRLASGIPHGPLYLWLIPVLTVITAAPIAGVPRYRLPADPFLLILAAIGATWLWDHFARRQAA
jgi:4-amino-4-deoxy-L-arabinose transferase-like glycosyltransferase